MKSPRAKKRPQITESQLRRIVRSEIAYRALVNEGFLEKLKGGLKKIEGSVKKKIAEKSKEVLTKLKDGTEKLEIPEGMKEFLEQIPKQEGGESLDKITAQISGFKEAKAKLEKMASVDLSAVMSSGGGKPKAESINRSELNMFFILEEERLAQKIYENDLRLARIYAKSANLIKEEVVLAALAAWFTAIKTVFAVLGSFILASKFMKWVSGKLGFEKAEKFFEQSTEVLEEWEKMFRDKVAFPQPLQYAAYRAAAAAKGLLGKKEDILSYDDFEGSDAQKKVGKTLHFAVLIVGFVEAAHELGEHLHELIEDFAEETLKHSAGAAAEFGKEAIETGGEAVKSLAKTAQG
ncbi:MAG: hypothetical protein EBR82_00635 [Caulobacteraceae bacterium]|nr:hypothetical protein [Caulobacteraceae bacterium]